MYSKNLMLKFVFLTSLVAQMVKKICLKCGRSGFDAFELWCWRRLLKSPLYSKEIQPVLPKGNQS